MNTDFDGVVESAFIPRGHRSCVAKVRASPFKSVGIPCTYTDFHGITTDLRRLLQRVNGVCTV